MDIHVGMDGTTAGPMVPKTFSANAFTGIYSTITRSI